jgi:hypothetical protein
MAGTETEVVIRMVIDDLVFEWKLQAQNAEALVRLAARVLLQHINDEDYHMSVAALPARLNYRAEGVAPTIGGKR